MAVVTHVGTIATPTVGGNQGYTGIGFTPKALIIWGCLTSAADGQNDDVQYVMGFCDGTNERCITANEEDAQGTTDASKGSANTVVYALNLGLATTYIQASFVSFDADGFTLNFTTAPGTARYLNYMAIGGDDITDVLVGDWTSPNAAAGNQSISGVGFQPDFVLMSSSVNTTHPFASQSDARTSFGFATATEDAVHAGFAQDGQATQNTSSVCKSGSCLIAPDSALANIWDASIVSMDADGFTINWGTNTLTSRYCFYLAIKGGQWDIGSYETQTSTGNFSITGTGFTPVGMMNISNQQPLATVTFQNDWRTNFGGASDASEEGASWSFCDDGGGTSQCVRSNRNARVQETRSGTTNVLVGDIQFISFDSDGFTLDQNDDDSAQRGLWWFVVGSDAVTPVVIPVQIQRLPTHHRALGLSVLLYKPTISSYTPAGTYLGTLTQYSGLSFKKSVDGGYKDASITIPGSTILNDDWLENGIGRHVEIYNHGNIRVYEGFVNKVTINMGGLSVEIGPLVDIVNRVSTWYTPITGFEASDSGFKPITGDAKSTTIDNDTDSQALYGIIEKVLNLGQAIDIPAESIDDAQLVQDTYLAENAMPKVSQRLSLSGGGSTISLQIAGYKEFLGLFAHNDSTVTSVALSAKLQSILGSDPNSVFSTDYSDIVTNASLIKGVEESDRDAWTQIKEVVSYGDASGNRYVFMIGNDRKATYRQASDGTIKYYTNLSDPSRNILDSNGNIVRPWDIEAGNWLFVTGFLAGRGVPTSNFEDDPRMIYIEQVSYTAPYSWDIQGGKMETLTQILNAKGLGGV